VAAQAASEETPERSREGPPGTPRRYLRHDASPLTCGQACHSVLSTGRGEALIRYGLITCQRRTATRGTCGPLRGGSELARRNPGFRFRGPPNTISPTTRYMSALMRCRHHSRSDIKHEIGTGLSGSATPPSDLPGRRHGDAIRGPIILGVGLGWLGEFDAGRSHVRARVRTERLIGTCRAPGRGSAEQGVSVPQPRDEGLPSAARHPPSGGGTARGRVDGG
jgi:hypothetical protein